MRSFVASIMFVGFNERGLAVSNHGIVNHTDDDSISFRNWVERQKYEADYRFDLTGLHDVRFSVQAAIMENGRLVEGSSMSL